MIWVLGFLGCTTSTNPKSEYTTVTEPATETAEPQEPSGPVEPETGPEPHPENLVTFLTSYVSCSRLLNHTLTLTRMLPGELVLEQDQVDGSSAKTQLLAEFYDERYRLFLAETELEPQYEDGQTSSQTPSNCSFSIELPTPEDLELVPIGGDESDSTLQWTFYYPAMFVGETITCDDSTYSCSLEETPGTTIAPTGDMFDPQLASGDYYDWASDTYFVYISGDLTASFVDMGFKRGWNLAQFDGDAIIDVQAVSEGEEGALMPVEVRIEDLVPRYQMALSGGKLGIDTNLADGTYTMGTRPLGWLSGTELTWQNQLSTPSNFHFRVTTPSENSDSVLEMYIWGVPPTDHFFPLTYSIENDMYQQWAEYVDVAPEIPVAFTGTASQVEGNAWVNGQQITYEDAPIGALCSDSERVIFAYYDTPDTPSETLWYRLTRKNQGDFFYPGWHALVGSQGESKTWRFVVESSTSESFNYTNLALNSNCTVFEEWMSP